MAAMPAGILAVFNDCTPEGYQHFERWYLREHLQERVGVPGFRFGRRYELVSGGNRRFFAFYEVENPDVLSSPAYLERLNAPTAWTQETMRVAFRNSVRTVCDLRFAAGDLIGAHATVLRADGVMAPTAETRELVRSMAAEKGIARVQVWTASARQTPSDTAEMKSRAKDRLAAGAFVVECVRRQDAEEVAARLTAAPPPALGIAGASAVGVYALLCVYPGAKALTTA
jgi:hypothetical protein